MPKRRKLTKAVETAVLTQSGRRCCICFALHDDHAVKDGQIAHLDDNPSNNDLDNLAWLCLDHHARWHTRSNITKGYTAEEVKAYRDRLRRAIENNTLRKSPPAFESERTSVAASKPSARHHATKPASAMNVGLVSSDHVPRTAEELEGPILEALYALRFTHASCPAGQWKGEFRLQFVPAPILRAWLRILPNELSCGVDRLQLLGYIEFRAGSVRLPLGARSVQPLQHPQQLTTELIVERPEGGHVAIVHVLRKSAETTIALGGVYSDGKFRIDDPGAPAFSVSQRGHVPRYCLTARGMQRVEELRTKQPLLITTK